MDNKKLSLTHTALYAKGWYHRGGPKKNPTTVWDDLKKCLGADGYLGDLMSDADVTAVILHRLEEMKLRDLEPSLLIDGIHPSNCWKYGYMIKNYNAWFSIHEAKEYNLYEAVVHYCLSTISIMMADKIETMFPNFHDVLPRKKGITDKQIKASFTDWTLENHRAIDAG